MKKQLFKESLFDFFEWCIMVVVIASLFGYLCVLAQEIVT